MLACLHVPLFPLAARLRSEPDLKGDAVAVFEGNGNAARVVAAARRAREKGIQPGMTLPQARSICPGLTVRPRDLESERAAQEALLEVADTFSPRVEDAGEGLVYLDLEGLPSLTRAPGAVGEGLAPSRDNEHVVTPGDGRPQGPPLRHESRPRAPVRAHHDQDEPERETQSAPATQITNHKSPITNPPSPSITNHKSQITNPSSITNRLLSFARDIIHAAEKSSLPLRVGIAASKLAARVAAGLPDSPTVVPEGEERQFLARLPLSRLAPQIDIAETLERWGIRSIGEFARLPEGEVASRLGELGRELHAAARGIDPRPLEPRMPPPCLSEGMDLEWPLATLEPFLFLGNAALERLVARLESQGLACVKLEVTLKLDPDGCDARAIALPAPTREVRTLLTLMRLELEARPPGAPVSGFTFAAHPDQPRRAQLSLFGPAALSPDRLATTIARLAALLGADRVGSPRAVNGHRPERFTQVSYSPPPPPTLARPPRTGRGLLAVRVLRPPIELEVITESRESRVESREKPPLPPGEGRGEGATNADAPNHERPPEPRTPNTENLRLPVRLLSLRSQTDNGSPQISGSIKVASGPWSLEEGWWKGLRSQREESPRGEEPRAAGARAREGSGLRSSPHPGEPQTGASADPEQADATFRDYWDVELSDGALYRIYRDRKTNVWFADGIYD